MNTEETVEIKNLNNAQDMVTVKEVGKNGQGQVYLNIGETSANPRHARLSQAEARAVAYALLSYAEQISH
jgi:hypothetical protein